ncbi:MAG: hypothetical protein GKR91_17800 [Pseudomonadales bacterium]|nr:hypothetical protein [Pseudomonadales bacterium]
MGNGGWYGTPEEWAQIEQPLIEVDPIIDGFVDQVGLSVRKNYKDNPERSIIWGDNVRCLIQLYLSDEAGLTFNLWFCASQDRGNKRYWKQEMAVRNKRIEDFREDLESLLNDGYKKLTQWSGDESVLELVTELG